MPQDFDWSVALALAAKQPETDADYAALRLTSRTYVSKTFLMQRGTVQDLGQPARFIHRVFDHPMDSDGASEDDLYWTEHLVHESPGGRVQITLQIARAAGTVRMIQLRRVTTTKAGSTLDNLAEFDRTESSHLVSLSSRSTTSRSRETRPCWSMTSSSRTSQPIRRPSKPSTRKTQNGSGDS